QLRRRLQAELQRLRHGVLVLRRRLLPQVLVLRGAVRRLPGSAPAVAELPVVVLQGAAVLLQVPVVVLRGGAFLLLLLRRREGIVGVLLRQALLPRRRDAGAVVPRVLLRLLVLLPEVQRWVQPPVVWQSVLCRRMLMLK
ncbi:Os08g0456600, partial [Oryza sativa Japonica Group]